MDDYDLEIFQGSTFSLSVTLTDSGDAPIDLTNYLVSGYLKYRHSDSAFLTSLNPTRVEPYTSGVVSLSIPHTGTAALPVTLGFYDLEICHTGNDTVDKVLKGKAYIHPQVTY